MHSHKCPEYHPSSLANGCQIPQYAREEYTAFQVAIEDLVLEEDREVELEEMLAVKRIAYTLNNVIYIIASIIKESRTNLLVFTLLEGIQGILDKLDALRESIKALPTSLSKLVITRASSSRSSRSRRRSQRSSRASPRKDSSSLLVDLDA